MNAPPQHPVNPCGRGVEFQRSRLQPGTSPSTQQDILVELVEQAYALGLGVPIKVSLGRSVTKFHYPALKVDLP